MSEAPSFVVPPKGGQSTDSVIPRFYIKPLQNNFRTENEGRPIFEDVEYVEILIPGDMRTTIDRRVKAEDKARWPQYYAAFKEDREFVGEGLPLSEWPAVTRSQVEEFKHFRIKTVQQLANLSDDQLGSLGLGGRALRDQARAYVESASGGDPTAKLIADGLAKDVTIAAMQEQLDAMQAQLAKLTRKDTADGS